MRILFVLPLALLGLAGCINTTPPPAPAQVVATPPTTTYVTPPSATVTPAPGTTVITHP